MNSESSSSTQKSTESHYEGYRFYTETIEVTRMSALAFFEAGGDEYLGKRMYWQNREKTFTLVGIGHAHVLSTNKATGRFKKIKDDWKNLCKQIVNEESSVQPVLFGGFSFDPLNSKSSEWTRFPQAYFAVPTFQLVLKGEQAFVSIHLITEQQESYAEFDAMRKERDKLIHAAQVSEVDKYDKPQATGRIELRKEEYLDSIQQVTDIIKAKKVEKVVIARTLKLEFEHKFSPSSALYQVSNEQPESFLFGLEAEEQFFFGATPERLVKVEDQKALSTCLAGSTPRGKTVEKDTELGEALLKDPKNRAEHQFVVKMISDVFEANCSRMVVPKLPKLMKIRDIQHLYTPVEGELKPGATLFDLVEVLHPTPALGGEPKLKALQMIREHEAMNRGYYAAPIGWIDAKGDGEFAVSIRSALLDGERAYLYAGGGIVADSTPQSEYDETWVKFRPMLRALGGQLSDES
ncbi:menaquinone-specific isochorismate synthase [Planococcus antarcticus DSM 14505]|uniref:isochorismate synthase n=1 Tax=Planococcus antarcticus DSM 14505 TaxID=1185653 RepID=A0A1C7DJA1_9BACL|nr:isochorismate synthase [Planococcus antarcticus]ANU11504.1 isochorismate synthase [Planococcus antarcticus DSM 14505]EIM05386.1 menaquinone-specific isochorismate synthase [Planococcus antarcticus DSM 14505]